MVAFKQINRRKSKNIISQSVAENIEAFNIKIPQIQQSFCNALRTISVIKWCRNM